MTYFRDGSLISTSGIINNINTYLFSEIHKNHLGSTDNFIQSSTSGNGTSNLDSTNHERDLSTGITNAGYVTYESKTSRTPTVDNILTASFILKNLVNGVGGTRETFIGLSANFSLNSSVGAYFYQGTNNNWLVKIKNDSTNLSKDITSLSNNDKLSVIISHNKFIGFYINGTQLYENTLGYYDVGLKAGVGIVAGSGITSARTISIGMINENIYRG